jgi:signal transduction histidine kinase
MTNNIRYRALWPLLGLLAVEALAFAVAAGAGQTQGLALPVTRLSIGVAALVLLAGLLPAALRPSLTSVLAGSLVTLLAGFLVVPFDPAALMTPIPGSILSSAPLFLLVRLANGAGIGPLALHFAARFPDSKGTLLSVPTGRTLAWCYAMTLALLAALLVAPTSALRTVAALLLAGWEIGLLGAAIHLLIRSGHAAGPERQRTSRQARLLLISIALAEAPLVARPLGFALGLGVIPYDTALAGQIVLPLGIAYSILRHDLFGIDAALRRALAYAALSVTLLAIYFGLTEGLTVVMVRFWPQFSGMSALAGVFAAAAAFAPLQRRTQRLVDQALYPERLTFQRDLAAARATLARVVGRAEVTALLTRELPLQLGASSATLALAPAPETSGPIEPAWNAALVVGGTTLGRYWLGPRRSGARYDADEQAQLQALVQQAALALAYAEAFDALGALNRDLEQRVAERTAQALQQQRALAIVEERQRLARALHDSVTQTLFSISLGARAIRGLLRRDTTAAAAALSEQEAAAQQALAEMRSLLAQLRGPTTDRITSLEGSQDVDQVDLVRAIFEHCAALERRNNVSIALELPAALYLPTSAAGELLYVVREALHNVGKHSGEHAATCGLTVAGTTLVITIADRGKGFEQDDVGDMSFGLRGMRERAAALGGTLEITSSVGAGTVVRARVPLPH